MPEGTDPTDVERQYAAAYETHYVAKDFSLALELCRIIVSTVPAASMTAALV